MNLMKLTCCTAHGPALPTTLSGWELGSVCVCVCDEIEYITVPKNETRVVKMVKEIKQVQVVEKLLRCQRW